MNSDLSTGLYLLLVTVLIFFVVYILPSIKLWIKSHISNADLVKLDFWANAVVEEARATGLVAWGEKMEVTVLDELTSKLDALLLAHGLNLDVAALETLVLKEIGPTHPVVTETNVLVPPQPPAPTDPNASG